MARELRRLLIPPERLLAGDCRGQGPHQVPLTPQESHYLQRVLRLRSTDGFAIADGAGRLWTARLAADGGAGSVAVALLDQPLASPALAEPLPSVALELAIALPKRDGELLLRMACELGLDRLTPLLADRSAGGDLKPQRCMAILREAAEQCERLWLPRLAPPQPATACLGQAPAGVGLLATTRKSELPLLAAVLAEGSWGALPGVITVAVGPEGGWSPKEEALAQEQGWIPVSLGTNILRTATAAVAAASLLSHWRSGL